MEAKINCAGLLNSSDTITAQRQLNERTATKSDELFNGLKMDATAIRRAEDPIADD